MHLRLKRPVISDLIGRCFAFYFFLDVVHETLTFTPMGFKKKEASERQIGKKLNPNALVVVLFL